MATDEWDGAFPDEDEPPKSNGAAGGAKPAGSDFPDWDMSWAGDVSFDPPEPLFLDLFQKHGLTLLVAAPGVGKGLIGALTVREAIKAGHTPCVYDAEDQPNEWLPRMKKLGVDLSKVVYLNPVMHFPVALQGKPVSNLVDELKPRFEAKGVDLLIVDSVMPALGLAEEAAKSDPSIPWKYVAGMKTLGMPVLSFAHPPKGATVGDAFGSYAWRAAHRLVFNATAQEGDGHRVRLTSEKANGMAAVEPVLWKFEFDIDRLPHRAIRMNDSDALRDKLYAVLLAEAAGLSKADIVETLMSDWSEQRGGQQFPGDQQRLLEMRVKTMLSRMAKAGEVNSPGARKGGAWTLSNASRRGI